MSMHKPTLKKILIVKLGALGDVINTLPAVIQLKTRFQAEIHWLVAPLSHPLVAGHPAVDHTILFDRHKPGGLQEPLRELRRTRYDLAIDFQRTLKSGLFCMAARAHRRLGFDRRRCKELTWLLPFTRIPAHDPGKHMLEQYLDFCRYLGISPAPPVWHLPSRPFTRILLPRMYAVLNIGATKRPNLWAPEYFARLARRIANETPMTPVLTGGPEDKERSLAIAAAGPHGLINLTGSTTLLELSDILERAQVVVSCDTGPMHLAVAKGTRTIALFGPSTPRRTGPFQGEVITAAMDCAPCNRRHCDAPRCMDTILPDQVFHCIIAPAGNPT